MKVNKRIKSMSKEKANYEKHIIVPMERDMWKSLKKISFDEEVSMNKLVRGAVKNLIKKRENKVDL